MKTMIQYTKHHLPLNFPVLGLQTTIPQHSPTSSFVVYGTSKRTFFSCWDKAIAFYESGGRRWRSVSFECSCLRAGRWRRSQRWANGSDECPLDVVRIYIYITSLKPRYPLKKGNPRRKLVVQPPLASGRVDNLFGSFIWKNALIELIQKTQNMKSPICKNEGTIQSTSYDPKEKRFTFL